MKTDNIELILDCELLTGEEKILFLVLERLSDNDVASPDIKKLKNMTGWSEGKIRKSIHSLHEKGVIEAKRQGMGKNNLYTIRDYDVMWESDTVEGLKVAAENPLLVRCIRIIKSMGGKVTAPDGEDVTDV